MLVLRAVDTKTRLPLPYLHEFEIFASYLMARRPTEPKRGVPIMRFRSPIVASVAAAALAACVSPAFASAAHVVGSNVGTYHLAPVPNVAIGPVGTTENTYNIDVKVNTSYVIRFQVNYPETSSVLSSSVDGTALPDVVSPIKSGAFAAFAYTRSFKLAPGQHSVTVQASALPSGVGIYATLDDATATRP
jgi:hypothetical protein